MYALTGAVIGILQFCSTLLVKFFLSKKKDYLITFLLSGTLCVIKLVVLVFFDDKEKIRVDKGVLYDEEDNNKENEI